jgi:DNA integrity scanning protein DisA with diadenylate cyclase activity
MIFLTSKLGSGLILKDIINLTEEELERFDGIGKTKAKKLRLTLVCKRFWIN